MLQVIYSYIMWELRFAQRWSWRFKSSGLLLRAVGLIVRTSQWTHRVCITRSSRLLLLTESVSICCDCRIRHKCTVRAERIYCLVRSFVCYPSATGKCPLAVPRPLSRGSWPLLWRCCWYCSLHRYRLHVVGPVSHTPPCWISEFLLVILRTIRSTLTL